MKPYEHYLEAERLLAVAETPVTAWASEQAVAKAAVHARLALVNAEYSDSVVDLDYVGAYHWAKADAKPEDKPVVIHPSEIKIEMKPGYIKRKE